MTDIVERLRAARLGMTIRLETLWPEAADEIERLRGRERAVMALVVEQANDDGLWFQAETCAEAHVQSALRRLHAAIEGKSPEQCAIEVLRGDKS